MTFSLSLAGVVPATGSFLVQVNSAGRTVSSAAIVGGKVRLTLSSAVAYGDIITVSYTKPATNPLQTAAGGIAGNISAQPVTNNVLKAAIDPAITIKMTISPNHVHKIMTLILEYSSSSPTLLAALAPELFRVTDLAGILFMEQKVTAGATNIKVPLNLKPGIYAVILSANGKEMATQRMIVY
jgi:hypothetical protein